MYWYSKSFDGNDWLEVGQSWSTFAMRSSKLNRTREGAGNATMKEGLRSSCRRDLVEEGAEGEVFRRS